MSVSHDLPITRARFIAEDRFCAIDRARSASDREMTEHDSHPGDRCNDRAETPLDDRVAVS
jgi:hypothetical protein